jgi:8-oxo-dGTP diphosphatase
MTPLVDAFWRLVYRLGYPCAQVVWRHMKKPGHGASVAVWHDGRLLCIRESYRQGLALPGGGGLADETPAETARRELFEEVGIALPPEAFRERGLLAYENHGRAIEDKLFEAVIEEPLQPSVDRREVVWAGFLAVEVIRAERMQRGLRLYLSRIDGEHATVTRP